MIYSKDYRDSESFPTLPSAETIGTGHISATESMAYNITQMNVKGK